MVPSGQTNALDNMIIPREENPYGVTWEDWTVRWWRWLLSIGRPNNPGMDPTGANFNPDQGNQEVLFLAGTFEGHAKRYYTITNNKAIFFPIINFTTSYTEEPFLNNESELITRAKEDIDSIVNKKLIIDGMDLQNIERYRVRSDVFELMYPEDNVFGFRPGLTTAISDGFWVFLKPLSLGRHTICASGSCYSGRTTESIIWHLKVLKP